MTIHMIWWLVGFSVEVTLPSLIQWAGKASFHCQAQASSLQLWMPPTCVLSCVHTLPCIAIALLWGLRAGFKLWPVPLHQTPVLHTRIYIWIEAHNRIAYNVSFNSRQTMSRLNKGSVGGCPLSAIRNIFGQFPSRPGGGFFWNNCLHMLRGALTHIWHFTHIYTLCVSCFLPMYGWGYLSRALSCLRLSGHNFLIQSKDASYKKLKALWAQDLWQMWLALCSGWGTHFSGLSAWTSC